MRVLFVSASGALGGAERVLLDLLAWRARARRSWQPTLLSMEPGPLVSYASRLGVGTRVLPLPARLAAAGESAQSPARLAAGLATLAWPVRRYLRALSREVAALNPDIVHSNGLKPHVLLALASPRSARLVWHVHDYLSARATTARLLRVLSRRSHLALATSESLARDVRQVLPHGPPVVTVLNGVDVEGLGGPGPHADLDGMAGLPPAPVGTVRVGLIGTFARWKGHETFLQALARVQSRPIRGYVIGGPLYRTGGSQYSSAELADMTMSLGLSDRVGFTGFQEERAACLRSLDIVVHASTAPEPFGLVVAEAMAAGRAVITSATGGSAELVQPDVDCLTHRGGDARGLADAIERLARDQSLRLQLGKAAVRAARGRFTVDRFGHEVEAAYRTVRPVCAA